MDHELRKIRNLIRLMRNQGVLELKLPDLELKVSPDALNLPEAKPTFTAPSQPETTHPEYSPEEILSWSMPGLMSFDKETPDANY